MGRLKRSCVVGSVVFHALTLALLVLAPVLLAKRVEKVQVIDLIPSEIVDQIMAPPAPVAPPTPSTPTPPKPTPSYPTQPNQWNSMKRDRNSMENNRKTIKTIET